MVQARSERPAVPQHQEALTMPGDPAIDHEPATIREVEPRDGPCRSTGPQWRAHPAATSSCPNNRPDQPRRTECCHVWVPSNRCMHQERSCCSPPACRTSPAPARSTSRWFVRNRNGCPR